MEAWPGSGSSVWCLLDKQAPGPGVVVDECDAGDAPARVLNLFLYTHKRTQTPAAHTHSHIQAHEHTSRKGAKACLHTQTDIRWTVHDSKVQRKNAEGRGRAGKQT